MSVTDTVMDPAGPALTATVRLPGLGGTLEPGTVVVGAVLVVGTEVVGVTVVVGAADVVGVADVVGAELVDGVALVEGEALVDGLCEVVLASVVDVDAGELSRGALNATAAVRPTQTANAALPITSRRLVKRGPP